MNELITVNDGQAVVSSLDIAEHFEQYLQKTDPAPTDDDED